MKKRVYYWFNGVPEDRLGGPWWYRTFYYDSNKKIYRSGYTILTDFVKELEPQCHKIIVTKKIINHDMFNVNIYPPKECI